MPETKRKTMNRAEIIAVLRAHGFYEGRCIAWSKTGYCKRNRDHFAVFNAQVFTRKKRILKQVDLDLTRDGDQLTAAARVIGQNLYVLYENAPHSLWRPGSTPMREVLRDAVWWTRILPQDQDVFLPAQTALRRPKRVSLVCSVGRWHGQYAYSLDVWQNKNLGGRNMFGAVVELCGRPPKGLRPMQEPATPNAPPFMEEPSPTKGRPVRPVFYQRSGPLDLIWFNTGKAIPAVLWDNSVGLLEGLQFTWHKGHRAIHVRLRGEVVGFIWPCSVDAREVVASATAQLRLVARSKSTEAAVQTGSDASGLDELIISCEEPNAAVEFVCFVEAEARLEIFPRADSEPDQLRAEIGQAINITLQFQFDPSGPAVFEVEIYWAPRTLSFSAIGSF